MTFYSRNINHAPSRYQNQVVVIKCTELLEVARAEFILTDPSRSKNSNKCGVPTPAIMTFVVFSKCGFSKISYLTVIPI